MNSCSVLSRDHLFTQPPASYHGLICTTITPWVSAILTEVATGSLTHLLHTWRSESSACLLFQNIRTLAADGRFRRRRGQCECFKNGKLPHTGSADPTPNSFIACGVARRAAPLRRSVCSFRIFAHSPPTDVFVDEEGNANVSKTVNCHILVHGEWVNMESNSENAWNR